MSKDKQVERFGPFKEFIADAVKSGDFIYLSGQVGVDASGAVVGEGDMAAQVRQAYVNIKDTLAKFDATMDDIVDEMWLVTDIAHVMANASTIWPIRAESYGRDPEVAQTMIQISALVMPELMIEIKCVAHV